MGWPRGRGRQREGELPKERGIPETRPEDQRTRDQTREDQRTTNKSQTFNSMNKLGTYFVDDVKMLDHVADFSFISTFVKEKIEPRLYMGKLVGSPGMTA